MSEWVDVVIDTVYAGKETKSGTEHTAINCKGEAYVQIYDDDAREEIESHKDLYEGEKVSLYLDHKSDGLYWLSYPPQGNTVVWSIIPNKHLAGMLFAAKIPDDYEHSTTEEEKQELFDKVEEMFA